ncbi:hypothetical protein VNO78_10281 [Psophocarpus tetragonolobus]|uniref:Uncharacterized protein n=1 Tax=Psophocarpus tetragonolobus TaxID=3891 RepID=A0AAN9SKC7_PSOTE
MHNLYNWVGPQQLKANGEIGLERPHGHVYEWDMNKHEIGINENWDGSVMLEGNIGIFSFFFKEVSVLFEFRYCPPSVVDLKDVVY